MSEKPLFGGGAFPAFFFGLPIVLLVAGGIYAMRARPGMVQALSRGEADGNAFGAPSRTASECLDGALAKMATYEEPREPPAAAFVEACLRASGRERASGAKHSAPSRGVLDGWTRKECDARGLGGDVHCARVMGLLNVDACRGAFRGQTKVAPTWECGAP